MIYCCGEALIDMVPRQLETGEDVFLPLCGGALFNTAITLGRLGVPGGFVSGISTDMFGEQLIGALDAAKVETHHCIRSHRPTTLAFVKLINGQANYTFVDENSAGRMIAPDDLPLLPDTLEALHFGGISLTGEPCGTAYETLMQRHETKAVISLDPNIRPDFITDPQTHRARIARMIAMSDIVKVSDEDLEWIAEGGDGRHLIDTMIAKVGVKVVILSKGADGVTLFSKRGAIDVPAQKAEVVDTIGAGDSFNGGFLAELRRSGMLTKKALQSAEPDSLVPSVELATKVAAITVSRVGADPPWATELD